MSKGEMSYIDPELNEAIDKVEAFGDFNSRREASRQAGKLLNTAFEAFGKSVKEDLETKIGEEPQKDSFDGKSEEHGFGFEHDLLGV